MRNAPLVVTLVVLSCSGQVNEVVDDSQSEDPITSGVVTTGMPEVGWLTHDGKKCTFTLVGAHTALTAAHCAIGVVPSHFRLHLDAGVFNVKRVETRADAVGPDFPARDVAILELTADVPGVRPAVLASAPPLIGEWISLVGYGMTSQGVSSDNQRHMGANFISWVSVGSFNHRGAKLLSNTCGGDSGGPAYVTRDGVQQLVGVHSQSTCDRKTGGFGPFDDNLGIETRVDTNRAYIEDWGRGDVTYAP